MIYNEYIINRKLYLNFYFSEVSITGRSRTIDYNIKSGMSFFYLSPVKGDITVYILETIVTKRLEYLNAVYQNQTNVYNEYVIEGSIYDVIGHFMLCIICQIDGTIDFIHFCIKSEEKLFYQRLNALSAYELRCFAKHLLKNIRKLKIELNFIKPLRILCQHLNIQSIAHHITTKCCENCLLHNIKVNFKHCLQLVAKRKIELNHGIASVPCQYWKLYLTQLFSILLKQKINNPDLELLRNDPRIKEISDKVKKITTIFRERYKVDILKNNEVDNKSQFFPPCMINLHQHLRKNHRLKHDQRFCYSLFLKDLGMPIEEAIIFWRTEYEKTTNGQHSCCHSWKEDENKFIYGIRHLYGLEGGRKSYISRNCQQIQNYEKSCSEGGCPFKSFDEDKMVEILNIKTSDPILIQIKNLQSAGNYTGACKIYLQNKYCFNKCDKISYNYTPVKFFFNTIENQVL